MSGLARALLVGLGVSLALAGALWVDFWLRPPKVRRRRRATP